MVIPHYAANMVCIGSDTNIYLYPRPDNFVGVILSRVVVVVVVVVFFETARKSTGLGLP